MTEKPSESSDRRCVDCGARSPQTSTSYTLISSAHGWRLHKSMKDGEIVLEWRCPHCWEEYKRSRNSIR